MFKPGIGAVLRALVTKNLAKMLAEPNLLVKSGQEGKFLAGSKIPIQVVSGVGAISGITIQYIDVGVKLIFKPEVMENELISLKLEPAEVSSISGTLAVNGYPIIDTREIKTSVQLKDGESLVLGGLLQEDTVKTMSKRPLLGDIPILGALFRSTQDDLKEKELVFFITPRLVRPNAPGDEPELPTDRPLTPQQEKELRWIPTGD
jgi:pilus assembly protein CpaC